MRTFARIGDVAPAVLIQQRPCWRKTPHQSLGAANAHLRSLQRNILVRNAETLNSYHCPHCGLYHVGHRA